MYQCLSSEYSCCIWNRYGCIYIHTFPLISRFRSNCYFQQKISGFTTTYGGWASIFTAVALCCFAFSTIIGWGLYGSRFIAFLCRSDKVVRPFFVVYSFVSILGATMDLGLMWSIADTFNGLMSIPNLIALLLLSGTVAQLTKEYFEDKGIF